MHCWESICHEVSVHTLFHICQHHSNSVKQSTTGSMWMQLVQSDAQLFHIMLGGQIESCGGRKGTLSAMHITLTKKKGVAKTSVGASKQCLASGMRSNYTWKWMFQVCYPSIDWLHLHSSTPHGVTRVSILNASIARSWFVWHRLHMSSQIHALGCCCDIDWTMR